MSFEQAEKLSDKELEDVFIKAEPKPLNEKVKLLFSLFPELDKQLKRKGVSQKTLWEDYKKVNPDGLCRTQFNVYFKQWKAQINPVMHMEHKAGDKLYVDFAGDKLNIIDPQTAELIDVEVFVSILGASQLTFAHAVTSQQKEDFISACESALHYYGGVPAALVPDNLKSAVTKSNKYEPTLNESFLDFSQHYGFTILPARAYKPRDKALVENAVRLVYNRIYRKLHGRTFFSLQELNEAIMEALEEHNNTLLTGRQYSRRQQFEEVERQALNPLPKLKFEFKKHRYATVATNGHVSLSEDKHYYSVPYGYIGKKVKLLYTRTTVEVFYNYERIAIHNRIKSPYNYTTDKDHMASTHRFVSEWTAERFQEWAYSIHQDVGLYIDRILSTKQHPEQGYKSCLGVLSLGKKLGIERLIKSCQRALFYEIYSYSMIKYILDKELDRFNDQQAEQLEMPIHENIRGNKYYN
ncbi:MAG: IS21 family transposase [Bacteroidota bacterium]|nr:IS21 family transposase [Bacteroidota bacterium]